MKNVSLVLLAAAAVAFAGLADAAPKKRNRNANRVGPYAMGALGQSNWSSDQAQAEQVVVDAFSSDPDFPSRNVTVDSEDSDSGYNFTFGYRFSRYLAAELGLAQFGAVESTGRGEMDFGNGFVPVTLKLAFKAGGPMVSGIGILPLNDKFELYGRLGYLFTSSSRELSSRVDGRNGGGGGPRGDSQDLVIGAGAAYHFNQAYSARLEYQQLDEIGDPDATGEEDLSFISLGVVIRF